jgi:hypothetical protein
MSVKENEKQEEQKSEYEKPVLVKEESENNAQTQDSTSACW